MPSSYTTSLRLTLPATGELTGTWGTTVNTGITELLDSAVAGTTTISTWGGAGVPYTLSNTDGAADEARKMFIVATGAPGEAKNVICPAVSKLYFFRNDTTGGFALTLKTSGGSGIAVPAGQYRVLYCNGTNVVEAFNSLASLTLGTALAASSGGTGQSTYTVGDLVYASGTTALSKLGIGTNGQILTSTGTAPQWSTLSGVAVTTFSAGTTGFTPSTATSGAVTLAGTLATTNGGTGLTSFTSGGVVYASSSSALTTGSALTFDGTTFSNTGSGDRAKFGTGSRNLYIAGDSTGVSLFDGASQTGNGWYINTASSYVAGYIGSSEQMRLTSTGLGIGTSSPLSKLVVSNGSNKNLEVQPGATTYLIAYDRTAGDYLPLDIAAEVLVFSTNNGTERMRLDSSGNLGIGTSSPASALGFGQTASGTGITFQSTDTTFNSGKVAVIKASVSGSGIGALLFETYAGGSGGGERMRLDSSGNLGIGTSSPATKLDVNGAAVVRGTFTPTDAITMGGNTSAPTADAFIFRPANNTLAFGTSSAEMMRLDSSGNLGLGVTPSAWLASQKALEVSGWSVNAASLTSSLATNAYVNASSQWIYKATGFSTRYDNVTGQHQWYTAPSGTAGNAISFTQAMTLDASGNLGVGVTSISGFRADILSASTDVAIRARTSNNNEVLRVESAGTANSSIRFINTSVNNTYISADGTALTFLTGGFERARITSGGDLLVGTASATFTGTRVEVLADTNQSGLGAKVTQAAYTPLSAWNSDTTGTNSFMYFYTEAAATARGSIDYNRAGGLVAYNTTSDYRAKDIIGPVQDPGATIDALKVYEGKMKGATQSRPMLIAHEAQEHAPYAVTGEKDAVNEDGTPKFQQMDVSSLVPLLLAEIQSLRARVAALESQP